MGLARADGGNGGNGATGFASGGTGGNGGAATVNIGAPSGSLSAMALVHSSPNLAATGVAAIANGGNGGAGQTGTGGEDGTGGVGGAGGIGGTATVVIGQYGGLATQGADTPTTQLAITPGVLVQANGGVGGGGGDASAGIGPTPGSSGKGGAGGTAIAQIDGMVSTTGSFAYGVLVVLRKVVASENTPPRREVEDALVQLVLRYLKPAAPSERGIKSRS